MPTRPVLLTLLAVTLAFVAEGCGGTGGSCSESSTCGEGEVCSDGMCVFALDAGSGFHRRDGGGFGRPDAGMAENDAGNEPDAGSDAGMMMSMPDAGTDAGSQVMGVPITCSSPASYQQAGGSSCGSERWSVKTGTDNDVNNVDMTPQVTTISALTSMPVPPNQSASCNRNAPGETQIWELKNVTLHFVRLESDADYHFTATDGTGAHMIVEVPAPQCVGHSACSGNKPFYCEITHARHSADLMKANSGNQVGTVIGAGFFDFQHGQTDVAPNAIELHPVLAICAGQDCNPLQGY